jgi:hypothetical protein
LALQVCAKRYRLVVEFKVIKSTHQNLIPVNIKVNFTQKYLMV